MPSQPYSHDIFISHASEDKETIARPLYNELVSRGVSVWFDSATLRLGDSLRAKIDEGLSGCRYGAVILSPTFLMKSWANLELDALLSRETAFGTKAILPVWHELDAKEVASRAPLLSGRLATNTAKGITFVADQICEVLETAGQVEPTRAQPSFAQLWAAQSDDWVRAEDPNQDFVYYSENGVRRLTYGDVTRLTVAQRSQVANRHIESCLANGRLKSVSPPTWAIPCVLTYINQLSEFPRLVVWRGEAVPPKALRLGETIDLTKEDFELPSNRVIRRLSSEGRLSTMPNRTPPRYRAQTFAGYVGAIPVNPKTFAPIEPAAHRHQLIEQRKRKADVAEDEKLRGELLSILRTNVDPEGWAVSTFSETVETMGRKLIPSEVRMLLTQLQDAGSFADTLLFDDSFAVRSNLHELDGKIRQEIHTFRTTPLLLASPDWELLLAQ